MFEEMGVAKKKKEKRKKRNLTSTGRWSWPGRRSFFLSDLGRDDEGPSGYGSGVLAVVGFHAGLVQRVLGVEEPGNDGAPRPSWKRNSGRAGAGPRAHGREEEALLEASAQRDNDVDGAVHPDDTGHKGA